MTEFGVVSKVENGRSTVVFSRPEACEKCGACGSGKHKHILELEGEYPVGNWLKVEMPEGQFLSATLLAYTLPLGLLLAGLLLGYVLFGQSDWGAAVGAGVGLIASIFLIKLITPRLRADQSWQPRVTGQYDQKPTQADIGCGGAPLSGQKPTNS